MSRILSKGATGLASFLPVILVAGVCLSGNTALPCCAHLADDKKSGAYYGCGWKDWDLGFLWLG